MRMLLVVALAMGGVSAPAWQAARLVAVTDGDTVRASIELQPGEWSKPERLRLLRVDAPELPTPEGESAKAELSSFLGGKRLRVKARARDKWGRLLVEAEACSLKMNESEKCTNLSDWLVGRGLARRR